MDSSQFWRVVELADRDALRDGDEEGAVAPLIAELAKADDPVILSFEEHLARALYDLDSSEHAKHAGESGRSGDGFLYARCYVVACGRARYLQVLADPAGMPRSIDDWCEALLYVGQSAWAARTGRDPDDWNPETAVSYETASNTAKWK